MRTCTIDGCEKAHRARGLCATHYNQAHQPERHAKATVSCAYCGEPCEKDRTSRFAARFCSLICRDVYRLDTTDGDPLVSARAARQPAMPRQATVRICGECECSFVGRRTRYCTLRCAQVAAERGRRMRKRGRHIRRRVAIFDRDAWRCHLCNEACDRDARVPDIAAATIDHVIPRSLGGTDDESNLRTAHFICNTLRGATPMRDAA